MVKTGRTFQPLTEKLVLGSNKCLQTNNSMFADMVVANHDTFNRQTFYDCLSIKAANTVHKCLQLKVAGWECDQLLVN